MARSIHRRYGNVRVNFFKPILMAISQIVIRLAPNHADHHRLRERFSVVFDVVQEKSDRLAGGGDDPGEAGLDSGQVLA